MRFQGYLYRALDVVWMHHPLSGEGARLYGGRLNAKGISALYTSLTWQGAVLEATQGSPVPEPTTLVSYEADIDDVLDLSTEDLANAAGVRWDVLSSSTWRIEMRTHGKSRSQQLALTLEASGAAGVIVPSFALGAKPDDLNLVLWRWGADLPHKLTVYDPDDRIGRAKTGRT